MVWLKENIGTIIVGLILFAAVAAIIVRLIIRKKAGKCIGCNSCDTCSSKTCGNDKKPDIKN